MTIPGDDTNTAMGPKGSRRQPLLVDGVGRIALIEVGVATGWKFYELDLPPSAGRSHGEIQEFAQQVLRWRFVRSVTIDGQRTAAVLCLNGKHTDDEFCEMLAASVRDVGGMPDASRQDWLELLAWEEAATGTVSFVRMPERVQGWRKGLYLLSAAFFLILGLMGVVLPGLPTTPFVLLGSFFLLRSSAQLHQHLTASRLFGGLLRDWHIQGGVRTQVRLRAIAVVTLMVCITLAVARPTLPVTALIVALVACGITVIWRLPSVKESTYRDY